MDAASEGTHLPHRAGQLLDRRTDGGVEAGAPRAVPLLRVLGAGQRQSELQGDGDQSLLGAVVQVALDPPPLGVRGRDDADPGSGQLVEAFLELAAQPFVVGGESDGRGDGRDQPWVLQQGLVVDQGRERAVVPLDHGHGTPGRGRRHPVGRRGQHLEAGILPARSAARRSAGAGSASSSLTAPATAALAWPVRRSPTTIEYAAIARSPTTSTKRSCDRTTAQASSCRITWE